VAVVVVVVVAVASVPQSISSSPTGLPNKVAQLPFHLAPKWPNQDKSASTYFEFG